MSFDFTNLVNDLKEKNKKNSLLNKFGLGSSLKTLTEKDFIKLPDWWTKGTNLPGLPFGKMVLIAGLADSGKSSFAIESMRAAQKQNVGIIYTETENKTTEKDLLCWGVDPKGVITIPARLAEQAYQCTQQAIDQFRETYPDAPLLVIIDSLGNLISMRDSEIDLTSESQKPGGKGSINRVGLNGLIARMEEDSKISVLLISYTYDNIGSVGKTNAGGQALNFFSSLTYQTSRKSWIEKTENGIKKRIGAEVVFRLYKNHLNKENPGQKEIVFSITKDGMSYKESKSDD